MAAVTKTDRAIVFLSSDNLYLFDGGTLTGLMDGACRQWFCERYSPFASVDTTHVRYDRRRGCVWVAFSDGLGGQFVLVYHVASGRWGRGIEGVFRTYVEASAGLVPGHQPTVLACKIAGHQLFSLAGGFETGTSPACTTWDFGDDSAAVEITDDKIKALRDGDFSEHADALEIIRNLPFVPGQAQANVDEVVSARVNAAVKEVVPTLVQQGIQINELTSLHPDWEEVRNEPGFDEYKKSLPQADQDKLRETWDIKYVAGHLTKYKQSKQKVQSIDTARRASRLAAGATASGTGSTSTGSDPEAEFDAGFKTRRVGN
jgi:hypothetical protein